MNRPIYYYPDDVVTKTENKSKIAKLGVDLFASDDFKRIELISDLPVLYSIEQQIEIYSVLLKNWLKARENYRAFTTKQWLDERKVVDDFWIAHRVSDYDPKNPKWTVNSYGKDAVTIEIIREWAVKNK